MCPSSRARGNARWSGSASARRPWPARVRSTASSPASPSTPPRRRPADEVADALAGVDLVVVENLLTIPLNLPASRVVAARAARAPRAPPPPRPALASGPLRPRHRAAGRRPGLAPRRHQPPRRGRAGRAGHPRPTSSTTPSSSTTPPGRATAPRCGTAWASTRRRPLLLHPVRAIERKDVPRRAGPGRRGRRDLLAARSGRGGLRAHPRHGAGRRDGPRPADAVRPRRAGRRATPRPTPCSSPRRGRASASRRSRRPSTAGRSSSATTRSPPSCGPSASAGCPRDDARTAAGGHWPTPPPSTTTSRTTTRLVRRHFSMAGLEAALADILGRAGWRP